MKRNTIYHLYEGGAIFIILSCWWMMAFVSPANYDTAFASLNPALSQSIVKAKADMQKEAHRLHEEIKKNGSSREGLEQIKRAKLLQTRTNETLQEINKVNNLLSKLTTVRETEILMIDQRQAYQLKQTLDKYVAWLGKEYKDFDLPKFEKLAEGNTNKALYAYEWPWNKKDFAHTYFSASTPREAIAMLNRLASEVLRYQHEIARKFGAYSVSCTFTRHEPMVYAPLTQIQVGNTYEAIFHVAISASKAKPRMTVNGHPVPVRNGQGTFAFRTQGTGKKHWTGSITLRSYGKDTTITLKEPYWVLPHKK